MCQLGRGLVSASVPMGECVSTYGREVSVSAPVPLAGALRCLALARWS